MIKKSPDPNLEQQDYSKLVKSQSTEALEKELSTLELQRTVLHNKGPKREAQIWQGEEECNVEDLKQMAEDYRAEMKAAKTIEERIQITESYEGDDSTAAREARAAAHLTKKVDTAQPQTEVDQEESALAAWHVELAEMNTRIRIVERELIVRRSQELSKGGAASALARARKLLKPSTRPLLYRSELKRAILVQLTQKPHATDLDICRGLDADGAEELPASWKSDAKDSSFAKAYMDSKRRHKVEIAISWVRADLRKRGLLAPR